MRNGKNKIPSELSAARTQLDRWRRTREQRKIPEALWDSAVELAGLHGVHRTARELRLNYQTLKARVEARSRPKSKDPSPAFVEVMRPEVCFNSSDSECVIELESAGGARMRVRVKGGALPDLAALGESFWNAHR